MAKTKHFMVLDGLRGVAALSVVCMHASLKAGSGMSPYRGYLAVDFFFMLSGLVMTAAYEDKLTSGRMGFFGFFKIRMIRLYPLIALGVILGAVSVFMHIHLAEKTGAPLAYPMTYHALWISVVLGLLVMPFGPIAGKMMPLDGSLWSIVFEIFANVVYASILRFLTRFVLGALILVALVLLAVQAFHFGSIDFGHADGTAYLGFARVCASFFMGVALFRLYRSGIFSGVPKISGIILALVLIASFATPKFPYGWIYDMACVLVVFPAVIICGLSDTLPARWLPVAALSGRLSYPVYALHEPIIEHLAHVDRFHGLARIGIIGATMALVVVISYGAMVLYDEPVRRLLSRKREKAEHSFKSKPQYDSP